MKENKGSAFYSMVLSLQAVNLERKFHTSVEEIMKFIQERGIENIYELSPEETTETLAEEQAFMRRDKRYNAIIDTYERGEESADTVRVLQLMKLLKGMLHGGPRTGPTKNSMRLLHCYMNSTYLMIRLGINALL